MMELSRQAKATGAVLSGASPVKVREHRPAKTRSVAVDGVKKQAERIRVSDSDFRNDCT